MTNHEGKKNGKAGKLRLRLHGTDPIRRRASPARATPREGHPSDGSPAREGSRDGQAGRSDSNSLTRFEYLHCYFLTERDRNRRIEHLRCRDASSVPFRKDLNSILRAGDYGPFRLFDRTVVTRLMAISEVIIPPTSRSP